MSTDDLAAPGQGPRALIGFGQVRHTRLRPRRHAFAYGNYFWLLPLRSLARQPQAEVHRNARSWLAFHDADHGDGGADALAWLDSLLRQHGLWRDDLTQGEVWLQAYPRVLGYVFKPVSFWYVHRADGALHAVVAEVNSTFGQRHCYVLRPQAGQSAIAWGQELVADKAMHVSPFCEVQGGYRFRFMRSDGHRDGHGAAPSLGRIVARVDHDDAQGPLLQTSVSGTLAPLTTASVRRAIWGWPWMTMGVVARIHWQALQLWLKRVPFHSLSSQPSPEKSAP
jgi:DUF1365 family protein